MAVQTVQVGHELALAADDARAQLAERPDYCLAVANGDGLLIGFARIGLGGRRSGELGYAIRHADWGHGYATEAAKLMIEFGFGQLDLHRIQAACGPDNHTSQRMLARLGFTPEGRMRDYVHTNGAWRDSLLYSVLAHEWENRSAHHSRDPAVSGAGQRQPGQGSPQVGHLERDLC